MMMTRTTTMKMMRMMFLVATEYKYKIAQGVMRPTSSDSSALTNYAQASARPADAAHLDNP